MTFYTHWRDVPAAAWRWPNFSPAEIACRGTGKLLLNAGALDRLQALRDRLGKPLIVRSAYRSPAHNHAVDGAKASKHLEGIAFDIAMANHDSETFEAPARAVGFKGFATLASSLAGCGTGSSDGGDVHACPPAVEYCAELQARAAAEVEMLLADSLLAGMISDYAVIRDQARACRGG